MTGCDEQAFLHRVAELVSQAKADLLRIEDEWGQGLSFDELIARGDDDVLLIEAVRADLAARSQEPEWEYGAGFSAALGGYWEEATFGSLEEARGYVTAYESGYGDGHVVLRRIPQQPPGPWMPVGDEEQQ